MQLSSLPRIGISLAALALIGGCKATEKLGPENTVSIIEVSPKSSRIYAVGDSTKFTAVLTTEAGTAGAGIEVAWVARDKSFLTVNSLGVAKSLKKGGSTYVIATAGGKSDSALVDLPGTPCGSVVPTTLGVGQVATNITDTGFCAASVAGAEYTAIVFNSSLASSGSVSIEVLGQALGTPPTTAGAALDSRAALPGATGPLVPIASKRDVRQELKLREGERALLTPLVASAQAWYRARARGPLRSAVVPAVGEFIPLNMGMELSCTNATAIKPRDALVKAVGTASIIVEDVTNPSGGFTDAEYTSMAAVFDTLINPVDVEAFGAPTDLDGNSRVIILFTKAINELTAKGATSFVGGRTMSRDLFPKTGPQTSTPTQPGGCPASNVAEMFYLLAPDPSGTVNGDTIFTKAFVLRQSLPTIAHEYQHLINFARRMYRPGGLSVDKWVDEIWLHEGLSHMAEELVFHRSSGLPTRGNIGLTEVRTSSATVKAFNDWMVGDFFLYDDYATETANTGPFKATDLISTRGATWSFFRYAADHTGAGDGDLWFRLVNSDLTGLTNLQTQLGLTAAGLQAMARDFVVSVYADDYVVGATDKYLQHSWNMRSIYPGFCSSSPCDFKFPLAPVSLNDNVVVSTSVVAGGFSVYRFKSINGAESFVRVTGASGGVMPPTITTSIVRTK